MSLLDDPQWAEIQAFLTHHAQPSSAILAPNELLEIFPGVYPYNVTYTLPAQQFDFVVFHKAMLGEVDRAFGEAVLQQFRPAFANDVFVVFAKTPPPRLIPPELPLIQLVRDRFLEDQPPRHLAEARCGIVVLTHNPIHLERSLPQIAALGAAIVVVDSSTTSDCQRTNQAIADRYSIPVLCLPDRGNPYAINAGVSYWLADATIEWISYFRDDVEVHPELLEVLAAIQDPRDRPLLTGRNAPEHQTISTQSIASYTVLHKRSTSGIHLHAHRDYWAAILPIPTPPLSAEQRAAGRGTEEDWWITAWSPRSITKQGGYVVCIPNLVRQFEEESEAWGALRHSQPVASTPVIEKLAARTASIAPDAIAISHPVTVAVPLAEPLPQETSDRLELPALTRLAEVKVLVDGYNLQLTSGTGIKTYSTSLIKALSLLGAQVDVLLSRNASKLNDVLDEVLFFDNQERDRNLLLDLFDVSKGLVKTSLGPFYKAKRRKKPGNFVVKQGKFSDEFLKYAESFNLPRCYDTANILYKKLRFTSHLYASEKIDIWHATYPLPIHIRGAKKITTIHDLIPLRLPYATLDNKEDFYFKVRDALAESDLVITVSEHSKRDLLEYFDADPDKIAVTYQPIALDQDLADDAELRKFLKQYNLEPQQYILFVGAIEPKKNVGRLLDAYARIDTEFPLVIVGKKGWLWQEEMNKIGYLLEGGSKKRVKLLEYVPARSLQSLYQGAYVLVFPSLYEGFGLPPLEAMTFGCPVITSNVSSLPEVCGSAALYVDPYDVDHIRQQLETLLGSPELRNQLAIDGKVNAAFFSMENYIQRLYAAYERVL